MYIEIKAAMDSIRAVSDILKASQDLRNYNALATAIAELNTKLMEATTAALASNEKQATLANRIVELERQLADQVDWTQTKARCELFQFPTGTLAYALKAGMEELQPHHYLCVNCFDRKEVSKLQASANRRFLNCNLCNVNIQIEPSPSMSPRRGSSWLV